MHKLFFKLFILPFFLILLTGCDTNGETVEPPYAGPMAEAALTSISDGDYEKHIELFLPKLHPNLPESEFQKAHFKITEAIGHYQDKEFDSVIEQDSYKVFLPGTFQRGSKCHRQSGIPG